MYEINGETFSESQIKELAALEGLTFSDYLAKNKAKVMQYNVKPETKPEIVKEEKQPVTTENNDVDLDPDEKFIYTEFMKPVINQDGSSDNEDWNQSLEGKNWWLNNWDNTNSVMQGKPASEGFEFIKLDKPMSSGEIDPFMTKPIMQAGKQLIEDFGYEFETEEEKNTEAIFQDEKMLANVDYGVYLGGQYQETFELNKEIGKLLYENKISRSSIQNEDGTFNIPNKIINQAQQNVILNNIEVAETYTSVPAQKASQLNRNLQSLKDELTLLQLKKAPQSEQQEILKQISSYKKELQEIRNQELVSFSEDGVPSQWYDPTKGKIIKRSSASSDDVENESYKSAQAESVWGDSTLEEMYTAENKLVNEVAYLAGKLGRFEDDDSPFALQRKSNMAGGGLVPGLKYINKNDILARKYNEKLDQLMIVQRSIALNYKPTDAEENVNFLDIFGQSVVDKVSDVNKALGGPGVPYRDKDLRKTDEMEQFYNFTRERLGAERSKEIEDKINPGVIEQTTGEGLLGFAQIALEFGYTRKAIGPQKLKQMENFFEKAIMNSKRLGKYQKPIAKFTTAVATEAAVIEARNKVMEPLGEERMNPLFAIGAAGTGSLLKGTTNKMLKSPSYRKAYYQLSKGSKTFNNIVNGITKPTVGTGVMTAGQLGETILAGHDLDTDGDGNVDILQLDNLVSTWMMVAALGTVNLSKGLQDMKRAIKNDVAFYRGEMNANASGGARALDLLNKFKSKTKDANGFELSELSEAEVESRFEELIKKEGLDQENLTEKQQKRKKDLETAKYNLKQGLKLQEFESSLRDEGGEQLMADTYAVGKLMANGSEIPTDIAIKALSVPNMDRTAGIILDPRGPFSGNNRARTEILGNLSLMHEWIIQGRERGIQDGTKAMSTWFDYARDLSNKKKQIGELLAIDDGVDRSSEINSLKKSIEEIEKSSNNFAKEEAYKNRKSLQQKVLDTYGDGVNLKDVEYKPLGPDEFKKALVEEGIKTDESDTQGFFLGKSKSGKPVIYINEKHAYDTYATSLDIHEITHPLFDNVLDKMSKAKATAFIKEFKNSLPASVKEQVDSILNNRGLGEFDKEVVAITSEVIAGGTFASKNSFSKAGEKISILMESNTPFKNLDFSKGADAFEFIKRFSQGVRLGNTSPEVQAKAEQMLKDFDPNMSKEQMQRSNKELDGIVGGKRDGVYSISNEAWKKKSESVVRDLLSKNNNNIKEIFNKYIGSKIGASNLKAGKEAFMQEVRSKLAKDIASFNPEQNNSFGGYIMPRINFRKGDVLKGEFGIKKGSEVSLDRAPEETSREIKSLESGFISPEEATDIALAKDREVKSEKPKTIIDRTGLPKEVEVNNEKQNTGEYVKEVSLKIRFDKLSDISNVGGPNQSMSNFLRDIRKQVVQSRDIKEGPIYKSMGTGKSLENYYNENFEKIVKNIQSSYFSDIAAREFNKKGSTTLPKGMVQKSVGGQLVKDASGKAVDFIPRYTSDWFGKTTDKMIKSLHGVTSQPEFIRINPTFDFNSPANKKAFFETFKAQTRKQGIAGQLMGKAVVEQILESSGTNDAIDSRLKDLTELTGRELQSDFRQKLKSQIASAEISRSTKRIFDLDAEDFNNYIKTYQPYVIAAVDKVRFKDEKALAKEIKIALQKGDNEMNRINGSIINTPRDKKGNIETKTSNDLAKTFMRFSKLFDASENPDLTESSKMDWIIDRNAITNTEKTLDKVLGTESLSKNKHAAESETVTRLRNAARDYIEDKIIEEAFGVGGLETGVGLAKALENNIALAMRVGSHHYDASKIVDGGYKDPITGEIILQPDGTNRFNFFTGKVEYAQMLNEIAASFGYTTYLDFNFYEDRRVRKSAKERVFKTGVVGLTDLELRKDGIQIFSLEGNKYSEKDISLKSVKGKTEVSKDGEADFTEKQLQDSRDTAVEARKELVNQMSWYTKALQEGRLSKEDFAVWTMSLKSGMGSILRTAAPVGWIFEGSIKGKKVLETKKGKQVLVDDYFVFEHMKPAEFVITDLTKTFFDKANFVDGKLTKAGEKAVADIFKDYEVAIIPKSMDNILKDFGLQQNMFVSDLRAVARYYNELTKRHPDLRSIRGVGKNEGKFEGRDFLKVALAENKKDIVDFNASENVISRSTKKTNFEILKDLSENDKAIANANKINKTIKKIRVFDFDDTLATSKSLVFYNKPNTPGKTSPKRKAIFMIGGPGSGKSNIGKGLELGREGWKVVNQDIFIESEKAKQGLPESEAGYDKEQRSARAKIGAAGRKAAEAKMEKYRQAGDGMVIDGTGASYNATMKKVNKLKEQGYDVYMIHAKTSNEVALERNRARKERSLKDFIVEKTQKSVNENVPKYKEDLGNNFIEIDTETIEYGKALPKEFVTEVKSKINKTERGVLTADQFAEYGRKLIDAGAVMDFSDFNIVREGGRGPLFKVAEKIKAARGNEDLFVLTARAPEAREAIYEFLKSEGLEFKKENIIGLGRSEGEARAQWLVGKAAEGYNDFYFADDAVANVEAVKKAMSVLDVKSKVQQAVISRSTKLSQDFNKMLENKTGIEYYKEFSAAKAKTIGASKGKGKFWIPYSAEDMTGLLYKTLGKGKVGDSQMAWWKQNFLNPYSRAMDNLSKDRVQLMSDFKELKKVLDVPKDLRKKNSTGFTNEEAVRAYLFDKTGQDMTKFGLSKTDLGELLDVVNKNKKLKAFGDQILSLTKGDGYATPRESWLVGTITTDLIDLISTTKRAKYLEEWKQNTDIIFSEANLNKLEAIYGPKYRKALENSLTRMKSGRNRVSESSKLNNQILDYINGSNAAIMFFNTRSAILQTISSINYVNWSFNNPLKAGAAFANQPQYWKDFLELMNSDYLKDRRNGLRLNITESEISDAAATSKNKAKAVMAYILKKGYLPTQYADSFAIAAGGATYYRNRINDLRKNQGLTEAKAKEIASMEWRQLSEESQQSSNPAKISQQQASDAGRLILMFANTPMQYARLQKRAFQDLVNRRGDAKTNMSKIAYYGFVQNLIFNALQQALFKIGFDEDEDKKTKAYYRTANNMLDSQLRGLGFGGQAVSVGKNFLMDIYERSKRKRPEYVDATWKFMQFSPPIGSKISKIRSAAYAFDSKKRRQEIFDKGFSLNNPAAMAGARVLSATTNIPLDRALQKYDNVEAAMSEETDFMQDVALLGGWPKWQIVDEKKTIELTPEDRAKSSNYKQVEKLNKEEQEDILIKAGYSEEAVKNIKTERKRVEIIIKANKKKYPENELVGYDQYDKERKALIDKYRKSTDEDNLKKLNKSEQVEILLDMGFSKSAIKSLKTEADRVRVIVKRNK